jgi:hypothetical protein
MYLQQHALVGVQAAAAAHHFCMYITGSSCSCFWLGWLWLDAVMHCRAIWNTSPIKLQYPLPENWQGRVYVMSGCQTCCWLQSALRSSVK